ncbi:MAG TPA: cytochrome c3 family protein [Pirellulaceae bacterium]|nr:cytochrome c3 family protein [Pirellulaceae bacterium]
MEEKKVARLKRNIEKPPPAIRRRRFVFLSLLLLVTAGVVWLLSGREQKDVSPSLGPLTVVPLPVRPVSPYLNVGPDAHYVGTQRCAECHADQHASFLRTAHSQSISEVDPAREPPDGKFDHVASGRRYQVFRRDGKLRHRESLLLDDGSELDLCDYPLKYLVGSGRFARSYVIEDAGFLVESPVTWYASLGKWAMSPGYDIPAHNAFHRTIEHACVFCHVGAVSIVNNNEQRVQLHETAIGCERCHGPGSLHAARWSSTSEEMGADGDFTIVNPRRLPRELAEAVCHQCHMSGEVQIAVRGRQLADYRPGLLWQDFIVDYGYETTSTDMTVVGHAAQMRQSRCYQASETLTCTTCHDPHVVREPAPLAEHHRATCLSCHSPLSCGVELVERTTRNGNDCAGCHMPRGKTDVPHVAFTHHRIGIHEPSAEAEKTDSDGWRPLVALLDIAHLAKVDRNRALGLAYIQYSRDHDHDESSQPYLTEARPLIASCLAEGLIDAPIALAQAELASLAGDVASAERWARTTLTASDLKSTERAAALRLLVGIALQNNRIAEATSYLTELTRLRRDPRDWVLLGVCRQRAGDIAAAVSAFERLLQIDPAQPETYQLLAPLYRAQNKPELENWCRQQTQLIQRTRRTSSE